MSYNVIDDGNDQLVKVAEKIIFDWNWSHGKSSRKHSPVSKTAIENAKLLLDEIDAEQDAANLYERLEEVISEAEMHNYIVSQKAIHNLSMANQAASARINS